MPTINKRLSVDDIGMPDKLKSRVKKSIGSYRAAGIDIELVDEDTVKITQARLINGYILTNKQLYDRAAEVFEGHKMKIIPVVFSLRVQDIDIKWVKNKMEEYGISRNDLISQLALDKTRLSLYFSGERGLTNTAQAAFFYYFLTYELNKELRAAM